MTALLDTLRDQFPVLDQTVHGKRLVYLDNAATVHQPLPVLHAMDAFYRESNANVHRGVHLLSQRATDQFEAARVTISRFINARFAHEVIFTKGCTEAINLVAHSWGGANLREGDEVLLSHGEHHANIVPWQLVAERTGAVIRPIPLHDSGELDLEAFRAMLSDRVKLVGVKHVCNALGTIHPIAEIVQMAKSVGALVLVDGAQSLANVHVDVQTLGVDFYSMSGHKAYGPMGVGALYGREELLNAMPPFQGGGDMIRTVSFEKTTFNDLPNKFEPGTPNVAGVIGLAAALDWVAGLDSDSIKAHKQGLLDHATEELNRIEGVRIIGTAAQKAPVVSFVTDFAHPHDLGTIFDQHGVAIRAGHHCCMPLMKRFGVPGTARASFAVYNTNQDIIVLIEALRAAREIFA